MYERKDAYNKKEVLFLRWQILEFKKIKRVCGFHMSEISATVPDIKENKNEK